MCVFFFSPTVLRIFVDEIVVFCLLIFRNALRPQLLYRKRVGPTKKFKRHTRIGLACATDEIETAGLEYVCDAV